MEAEPRTLVYWEILQLWARPCSEDIPEVEKGVQPLLDPFSLEERQYLKFNREVFKGAANRIITA